MTLKRVVVTGTGIYCPTGQDPQTVHRAWIEGRSAFTHFPADEGELVKFRGRCENLEFNLLPDRKVQKLVTRRDIIALIVAMKTATAAGIVNNQKIKPERFGMYVGSSSTQIGDLRPYADLIAQSSAARRFDSRIFGQGLMHSVNPMVMMQNLMNNTLCYASVALDIRGVNANFVDFQAAGLRAIGESVATIQHGRADILLAGGVSVTPDHFHAQEGVTMGFLQNNTPGMGSGEIRSYDRHGNGTILSEGSAFVVVESLEHAQNRGATILAEISDFACASEAGFAYVDHRSAQGLRDCIATVHERRPLARQLDIVGVGNGIAGEDFSELCAYEEIGQEFGCEFNVTSIKPSTGELSESSGIASMVLAIEGFKTRTLGGVRNFQQTVEPLEHLQVARGTFAPKSEVIIAARGFNGVSCVARIQAFNG